MVNFEKGKYLLGEGVNINAVILFFYQPVSNENSGL